MKLSKGRGIQFFKRPFFVRTQTYATDIVKASQKTISSAISYITNDKKKSKK